MARLDGLCAIVTGGASGIGAATSRRFVEEGASVVIADVQTGAGEKLAADLGKRAIFVRANHTKMEDNQALVAATLRQFGKLDVLCNNAGMLIEGEILGMDQDSLQNLIQVNLVGPYLMAQAALPALRANAQGTNRSMLFTGSVQSVKGRPGYTAYGLTKHGIAGLVKSLALELAPEGIRVNGICPGPTETQLFKDAMARAQAPDDLSEKFRSGIPMRRLIQATEVAATAAFLAASDASAITGALLPVDGGITAG
ncbi:SDR family NAD(P)-dependent oxidoreductase [Microvirga antarctica]|uniref:SDR family NAD(P)-dependent oxidoreductase n=1 Tax=Microvirga antarctica TaxID=2819233 RepID=UPI001B304E29|nr:glucose 1-dehydrogenase [Microvirga antarctica]